MKKCALIVLGLTVLCCSRDYDEAIKTNAKTSNTTLSAPVSLLWNDNGVRWRSFMHLPLINGVASTELPLYELSDLSQADNIGSPGNVWSPPSNSPAYSYLVKKLETNANVWINAPHGQYPSFKLVTEGYNNSEYGFYPGYAFWVDWVNGNPINFTIFNNAKNLSNSDSLHETGLVFEHYHNQWGLANYAFTGQYNLNSFIKIKPSFNAMLVGHARNNGASELKTSYLTADLRIEYWKSNASYPTRTDLLGVIFCNPMNDDLNGNANDAIFWKDWTGNWVNNSVQTSARILLLANKLGLPSINSLDVPTEITFDYIPLIQEYLPPPPPGYTYNDAIIVGFDVYSSVRNSDMTFKLWNVNLEGNN